MTGNGHAPSITTPCTDGRGPVLVTNREPASAGPATKVNSMTAERITIVTRRIAHYLLGLRRRSPPGGPQNRPGMVPHGPGVGQGTIRRRSCVDQLHGGP